MKKIFLPIGAICIIFYIVLKIISSTSEPTVTITPEMLMTNLGGINYIYHVDSEYPQNTTFCIEAADFSGNRQVICSLKTDKKIEKGSDVVVKMGIDRDGNALLALKINDSEIYGGVKLPAVPQQNLPNKKFNIGKPFFKISQQNKKYTLTLIAKKRL